MICSQSEKMELVAAPNLLLYVTCKPPLSKQSTRVTVKKKLNQSIVQFLISHLQETLTAADKQLIITKCQGHPFSLNAVQTLANLGIGLTTNLPQVGTWYLSDTQTLRTDSTISKLLLLIFSCYFIWFRGATNNGMPQYKECDRWLYLSPHNLNVNLWA